MGLITENERYNQVIDIWTHNSALMRLDEAVEPDKDGFNNIYMMFHRSTWFQTNPSARVCCHIAKPQKTLKGFWWLKPNSGKLQGGLSVLNTLSRLTRKGLGHGPEQRRDYLTRRLVDVAQMLSSQSLTVVPRDYHFNSKEYEDIASLFMSGS